MRKSQIKHTPDKSRSLSKSRLTSPHSAPRVYSELYYCHYKNAMYMGGIKSFKKEGRGIILHDNGICILTSYFNDLLHGHNIYFDNYCLLSAIYSKNKIVEAAFRTQGFLIFLSYNQDKELQGNIKLVNFITKSIAYAIFKKGSMIDKYEQREVSIINRVFQLGQLELIVGRTHSKILKYEFQKLPNIEIIKKGNKLIVGFQKNGFVNGLGFQYIYRGSQGGYNPDTNRHEDDFQLKMIERGYYINTQLCGMGSKVFKNGNLYIGEFKNGLFEGNGILKNSQKKNWVSGYFKSGNLSELLEYNSDGQYKSIDRIVEALHERKTNWINNQIPPVDLNFYVDQIERIITTQPNKNVHNLEQRKQEVLKKIQQKFIADNIQSFSNEIEGSIENIKNNSAGNSSIAKFINNLSPADTNRQTSNSDAKRNTEVKRKILARQDSKRNYDDSIVDKRSKSNLGKSKIFERSATSKTPIKASYVVESESQFNKRFVHSPGWIKGNEEFQSRGSEFQGSPPHKQEAIATSKIWHPLPKNQFNNSRQLRVDQTPVSNSYSLSSQQVSFSNKNGLDSKRMVAKSKIFKYLQNQQTSHRSPHFNDKLFSIEQSQRKREGKI